MSYIRNLILFATLIFITISASNASADADDFNLDFDDPANGESEVDPENIIEMKVQIENVVDQPMSFEMKILNDDDLASSGIDVWWSHNGDTSLTSKSDTIPKVDVSDLMKDVIIEISNKMLGIAAVLDKNKIVAVITDGDLRRQL